MDANKPIFCPLLQLRTST